MNTNIDGLQLPNIPIKIVRVGDKLKFTADKTTLELKPIPGASQTYPLLVLDKFISELTVTLLKKEIAKHQDKKLDKAAIDLGLVQAPKPKILLPDSADINDKIAERVHKDFIGE